MTEPRHDDDLVSGCLAGDESAWAELIDRYAAYVYAVARRAYGLTESASADVFQDTCVRVYLGLPRYSRQSEFRAWLRAVIISACRDHLRRGPRDAEPLEETASDPRASVTLDTLEQALDIRQAVGRLGEPCAPTIRLRFFEDLSHAEVARRLAVPEGTIAARLSRCLARLREILRQGDDPSDTSGRT